ncbi:DMT family transporter [Prevotella sp.]|uniref:DMT family transporter n=1 Tax=Prevotella sp. TaxID=59823 RepID=UPI002600BA8B|nr:DMT family transporter [Prevotella sp.]
MTFKTDNRQPLIAHLCILMACVMWGLMSPIGKDAMQHGMDNINLVFMRAAGGALLFWLTSLLCKHEHMPWRDVLAMSGAGLLGLVGNQCCFTIGLSLTTPSNASIVTTSLPIFAMILSALILKEPITGKKALGVGIGCSGALILIMSSAVAHDSRIGDIRGDLLCIFAQLSFALYLALYRNVLRRYSPITVSKWMFTWAALLLSPFMIPHAVHTDWSIVTPGAWASTAFVVFFGTFVAYLLMQTAQKTLRPTVVSIYNYMQPVVAVSVSLAAGMCVFTWKQVLAVALVFSGVWLVIKSKSRHDINTEKAAE